MAFFLPFTKEMIGNKITKYKLCLRHSMKH